MNGIAKAIEIGEPEVAQLRLAVVGYQDVGLSTVLSCNDTV